MRAPYTAKSPLESEKSKAAEAALPAELRAQYRSLVEDYHFATFKRYGRGYIAYEVLADLIRAGWCGPAPSTGGGA